MPQVTIDSDFDGGNIVYVNQSENTIELKIRKDINSDFFQWFYFKANDLIPGDSYTFKILNAGDSSYPEGWKFHNVPYSFDGETWRRAKSNFQGGVLEFNIQAESEKGEFAYFVPYSLERHKNTLVIARNSRYFVEESSWESTEGRAIELIKFSSGGSAKKKVWIMARQHPGETMAEWFMEGLINRIQESNHGVEGLLDWADLYLIPNINPDGSFHGNLRTNAVGANLNREWDKATKENSPEVLYTLEKMDNIGVDICLDIHGDEDIPYVFGSGAEGNPGFTERLAQIDDEFRRNWQKINPSFQIKEGYERDEPGKADLSLCTNQVSERYGAFALTIEMPFTDNFLDRDEVNGWSPEKSMALGSSSIEALNSIKAHF